MACRCHLLLIPRVFRPSPPFFSLPVKPFSFSAALPLLLNSSYPPPSSSPSPFLFNSPCRHVVSAPRSVPAERGSAVGLEVDDSGDERTEDDAELQDGDESEARVLVDAVEKKSLPELTVKEKKELASYAHSLGDKLKSQQIGKSGVTPNVFMALNETLEANELLKLKIHRTCPGELNDIVKQLEIGTGSVAVGQIGRIVIFYRPSISKLKAVEKKRQARKVFLQRKLKFRPNIQGREQGFRESGSGGPHGSRRYSSSTRSDQ